MVFRKTFLCLLLFDNVFADSCNYENWDNRYEDGNMFIIKPITLIRRFTINL